jgi:hypothetical protein
VPTTRLSSTPKTRARTSSGTARWRRGEQDQGGGLTRPHADEGDRRAPDDEADPEAGGETAPSDEDQREPGARQSAHAHGRVEEADSRLPHVQQVERADDDEDVERARHEGLGRVEAHEEA